MSDPRVPDMPGAHTPSPLKPCDVFSEEIHLLVDRELGPAESQVVEEHLLTCSRCQALAAQLERMSSVLKAWEAQANDVEAPALRLKHAVLARVSEQSALRRRDDRMIRVLHYATAALVVLGLGLGAVLGLTHESPRPEAPRIAISDAPMPLDSWRGAKVALGPEEAVEPYRAVDLLAGIDPVRPAEIEGADSRRAWEDGLWRERARDGLPLLVQRFQRMEALEDRLGEPVVFWNGAAADAPDGRLVTVSALHFLHTKGYLDRWVQAATPRSPTMATEPPSEAVSVDTGLTARSVLVPMPGIDRELRGLFMRQPLIQVHTRKPVAPAADKTKEKAKRDGGTVHLLNGWALLREERVGSGLRSGPIGGQPLAGQGLDAARIRFLDPVVANANGQLHFAESGQDADTVVAIVKGTRAPIYIPAGQFLTGGIADRVIAHPVWLPATRSKKPFIIHCRVVQNFEHGDATQPLALQREIAGPTIRALLAAGAAPQAVKAAAGRLLAAMNGQRGAMLGDWSLYRVHQGMHVRIMATLASVRWEQLRGFVVTDVHGRFLGSEIVNPGGPAATELLRRLWVSYSLEAGHRVAAESRRGRHRQAFAAPKDPLAQVLRRLGGHPGTFRTPPGVEQPEGARVSQLDVVPAGVHLHSLEVARAPAIVSALAAP